MHDYADSGINCSLPIARDLSLPEAGKGGPQDVDGGHTSNVHKSGACDGPIEAPMCPVEITEKGVHHQGCGSQVHID